MNLYDKMLDRNSAVPYFKYEKTILLMLKVAVFFAGDSMNMHMFTYDCRLWYVWINISGLEL